MSAAVHTPGPWRFVGDELYGADGSRIAEAVRARDAGLIAAVLPMLAALKSARDCISQDRQALADAHMDPATNRLDEDGQAGVDEYDAVLAEIDAAIARAEGQA